MKLKVKRLDKDIPMPRYAKEGDAGFDLRSTSAVEIAPGDTVTVGTGLAFEIPEGYVGLVFPRSGLGSRGVNLANCVGVIDSGYRGQVMAPLHNNRKCAIFTAHGVFDNRAGDGYVRIERGDRVAQMVVVPFATCEFEEVDELAASERGTGGFGSSGVM